MSSIFEVLGQAELVDHVASGYAADKSKNILISGRSGTGKTSFCKEVRQQLRPTGFLTLLLRGDIGRLGQDYYPFFNLLKEKSWATEGTEILKAAADDLPIGTSIIKKIADLVERLASRRLREVELLLHDPVATELVMVIRGSVSRGRTLLILDDFHAFDPATTKILAEILSTPQDYLGKYYQRLYVLASENVEEIHLNKVPDRDRILVSFQRKILSRPTKEQFPQVLKVMGFHYKLEPDIEHELYERSGGHLRVLAELVRLTTETKRIVELDSSTDILEIILNVRLAEPTPEAQRVKDALARIAVIGTTFSHVEVQCLLEDMSAGDLKRALDKSQDMKLIDQEGGVLSFQHPSIRHFFLSASPERHADFHDAFVNCLRLIRPSDYWARHFHLTEAGRKAEADVFIALHWSRSCSMGRLIEDPEFQVDDYGDYINEMSFAYRFFRAQDYTNAILNLQVIHDAYPDLLLVERDLLLAECYLEGISLESFSTALSILERWEKKLDKELEIKARLLYHKSLALILGGDYEEGQEVANQLMRSVAKLRMTDPGLQRMVNRIQLVSDSIYRIEVSGRRIYSALRQISLARSRQSVFNPHDLFVALVNYSGNKIIAGDYPEAAATAGEALTLWSEYQDLAMMPLAPAVNNHLLGRYLEQKITSAELAKGLEVVLEKAERSADHFLLRTNLANALALANCLDKALAVIRGVEDNLERIRHCDTYYTFYAKHVRLSILASLARWSEAMGIWEELAELLETLPPGLQEYLPYRHNLIRKVLEERSVHGPQSWDSILSNEPVHKGRPWRFFQRGFLFTDVQIWFRV